MKYGLNLEGDNRELKMNLGLKKEDGEPNFFEGLTNGLLKLAETDDEMDLIDQIDDETD